MTDEEKNSELMRDFELGKKLESIFKPEARRQRDAMFKRSATSGDVHPSEIPFRFSHYTSAEAALSIIKSKRVWMRNTSCMTDYQEVQHGYQSLLSFFKDKTKKDTFIAALDKCATGAAGEAIKLFDSWWQNIQLSTYITSLSEHDSTEDSHGRLSMWRAFQSGSARVAMIFKVPWMSGGARAMNVIFSPVAYFGESHVHAEIQEVIENLGRECEFLRSCGHQLIVNCIFDMLVSRVTCTKHEGFREEREWRATYSPQRRPSKLIKSSTEVVYGVPQLVYNLPLDAKVDPLVADLEFSQLFDRLIIGPSLYPWVMAEAFALALKDAGVTEPEKRVFRSGIPIRT